MSDFLQYTNQGQLRSYQNKRPNEQHVADVIAIPDQNLSLIDNLESAKQQGVKYVILGIPEDIGPRANCGRSGSDKAWKNLRPVLLNQQHNDFFDWRQCLLLGHVIVEDLQNQSYQATCSDHKLATLRQLCEQLDQRVANLLQQIFDVGLEAIVIGGGHNNAFPLLKALSESKQQPVNCVNLDPHADFRLAEGRHSGNPFRYAHQQQYLNHYHVVGMHEQKNNQESIKALTDVGYSFCSFQQLFMSQQISWQDCLQKASELMAQDDYPVAIEVDLDAIKKAPASAYSVSGFSIEQAIQFVYSQALRHNTGYLHLCEGAPAIHEHSEYKSHDVGQILNQLIYAYLSARSRH